MKKVLYLGTDPRHFESAGEIVHFPVIKIVPRSFNEVKQALDELPYFTHLVFTSKNAVDIFFSYCKANLENKILIAIGKVTALHLTSHGFPPQLVSPEETQEGMIELLKEKNLENAYLFLPQSSLSRPLLVHFLHEKKIRYRALTLYDTECIHPETIPDLATFDEIIFTSPSTVTAFFQIFSAVPQHVTCIAIGPVTQQTLKERICYDAKSYKS